MHAARKSLLGLRPTYSLVRPGLHRERHLAIDSTWHCCRFPCAAAGEGQRRCRLPTLCLVQRYGQPRAAVSGIPEDGHGRGVQLDLTVSYAVTDQFSLGVGGRYWTMSTTTGQTKFGDTGT